MRTSVVLGAAAALLLGGCGSGAATADGTVTLAEFSIVAPHAATAGPVRLDVVNAGNAHHNLTICPGEVGACAGDPITQAVVRKPAEARDPQAVPDETTALIVGRGWEATIEVELEPGRYRLWCAIVGHAAQGMDTVLTVT